MSHRGFVYPGIAGGLWPLRSSSGYCGLTATAGYGEVTLSWATPASDGGSPISGYNVYMGTTADFKGNALVGRVSGTTVTITGLVNSTTYYFKVTAVNRVGEGQASAAVSATTARHAITG